MKTELVAIEERVPVLVVLVPAVLTARASIARLRMVNGYVRGER